MEVRDASIKYSKEEISARLERSRVFKDKLAKANKGIGFHNCAGLAKYLLGLSPKDGFVRTGDSSDKGIIKYLNQKDIMYLDEFDEENWIDKSSNADAVAILHNDNHSWQYLHFMVPDPDPSRPFDVFQRNGFEEEVADIGDIRDIIKDEEYKGDSRLIFFRL